MTLTRAQISEYRANIGSLAYGDLIDIQGAFEQLDPATLRDLPENATTEDMLDELEDRLTPCGQSFATPSDAEAHRVTCGECAGVEEAP